VRQDWLEVSCQQPVPGVVSRTLDGGGPEAHEVAGLIVIGSSPGSDAGPPVQGQRTVGCKAP
jgi:hypothetical protein